VRQDWVVYSKRPFGNPKQLLKYLARYTHRVAISNRRLVELARDRIRFRYKDYRDGHRTKIMELTAVEFTRRFLMHVLPNGFMRIRHFGFLANRSRQQNVELCRELLGAPATDSPPDSTEKRDAPPEAQHCLASRCPVCQSDRLLIVERFDPPERHQCRRPYFLPACTSMPAWDTS
jgi:hypothetical protein